ncbi:hypothetical protein M422DRAFT_256359 [Sphaerobolus stellatus SS14]|uniref:Myb/SANT-like domain-containing protein n=1 Tax=Sphaerobolus stellatus (strain SS14) TaxID=990650 RepID=A0A0C9V0Q2_SPHS4|nr:hypothetical protein M422DRAFT_256359 [Sphaerobolus stellatus SS14]
MKPKTTKQVTTRFGNLKGNYAMVKKLRGLSGFGWDDVKMVAMASPEVWHKFLEANKKHTKRWNKSFPLYDTMAGLVDKVLATGSQVFQTQSIQCSSDRPDEVMTLKELDSEVEEIKEIKKGRESLKRSNSVELPPIPINKRRRTTTAGPDAINALAGLVASLAEAIVDSDKALAHAEDEEGLSDTDLVDAVENFEDTKVVDTYLAFKKKLSEHIG